MLGVGGGFANRIKINLVIKARSVRRENTMQTLITIIDQINLKIRQLSPDSEFSLMIVWIGEVRDYCYYAT